MLSKKEHQIARLREISATIANATNEQLTQNPQWFEELIELYNETLKAKPKLKLTDDSRDYPWNR
jgi:hypothetical protein